LKLIPKPPLARVLLASFASVTSACNAVAEIIAAGIIPAGLEMMDKTSIKMVAPFVGEVYDAAAEAILLCESDGSDAEVAEEILAMRAVLERAGANSIAISTSEAQRMQFWAGRKNAFPAAGRISPDYYCMDGSIPRRHLATVLQRISELSSQYGLACANVFHAGDGNLHPLILFDANQTDQLQRAEQFGEEILKLCVEVGGTITGEHGVGLEKLNAMCTQFNAAELACFHALKAAFDLDSLLNPTKAIPSLHRCAEQGRMHVKQGKIAFPDLARF